MQIANFSFLNIIICFLPITSFDKVEIRRIKCSKKFSVNLAIYFIWTVSSWVTCLISLLNYSFLGSVFFWFLLFIGMHIFRYFWGELEAFQQKFLSAFCIPPCTTMHTKVFLEVKKLNFNSNKVILKCAFQIIYQLYIIFEKNSWPFFSWTSLNYSLYCTKFLTNNNLIIIIIIIAGIYHQESTPQWLYAFANSNLLR